MNQIDCADALVWLKKLPDKYADIVVTSPPYNLDKHSFRGTGDIGNRPHRQQFQTGPYEGNFRSEPEYQDWLYQVIWECLRISKGLVWVNHKMRFREGIGIHPLSFLKFPVWQEIIWNRLGSTNYNTKRFAPSHEYVYGFGRPHFWYAGKDKLMTVWNIQPAKSTIHPCPFPSELIRPLIEASCPPGGLVVDPFSGYGTTAKVSKETGRNFHCCEISPHFVEESLNRIGLLDSSAKLPLFATGDLS